jgi:hypothetical protein
VSHACKQRARHCQFSRCGPAAAPDIRDRVEAKQLFATSRRQRSGTHTQQLASQTSLPSRPQQHLLARQLVVALCVLPVASCPRAIAACSGACTDWVQQPINQDPRHYIVNALCVANFLVSSQVCSLMSRPVFIITSSEARSASGHQSRIAAIACDSGGHTCRQHTVH